MSRLIAHNMADKWFDTVTLEVLPLFMKQTGQIDLAFETGLLFSFSMA